MSSTETATKNSSKKIFDPTPKEQDTFIAECDLSQSLFQRVSFDLIYARHDQTPEAWQRELEQALSLASGHLSLYQLTIEPGTAFHEQAGRGTPLVSGEMTAAAPA